MRKKTAIAVILTAALFVVTALGGCTLFDLDGYRAQFARSTLNVSVGDEYDLRSVIDSNIGRYSISSSDEQVAYVTGTTLKAVGEGRAVLTLSSPETEPDTMTVIVAQSGIKIEARGSLIQTMGSFGTITFGVKATGSVADGRIYWFVDGERKSIVYADQTFSYAPNRVGVTEISAKCATDFDISDTVTVRAYYAVSASGSYEGELVCEEGDAPIVLTADIESRADNPDDYVEWTVDGKVAYAGTDTKYSYSPTAGTHKIELHVNGVKRMIGDKDSITVRCSGSVVPSDAEVVYDNMYPHVYVRAEVEGGMQVEITSPDGRKNTFSQTLTPSLFDENGFDASDVITLCANVPQAYKIRVKSLGDGDMLYESEYGAEVEFVQLPSSASSYLKHIVHTKDHYITSDKEYVELFEYYVVNRSKTVSKPHIEFECYIGYDMKYSADQIWNYAFRIGATSGSYTGRGAWLSGDGKILYTDMTVNTVNNPSRQTYGSVPSSRYNSQLRANLPHINYDESKYRSDDHVFAIDNRARTASVRYTDELYLAAQNGAKPLPVDGSSAQTVYDMAREILRQIVTDEMTDKQKAHAIYDWIMWQVTYDSPATSVLKNGEAYSAYYLEGVFGDYETPIGGVAYAPYAVCDGMSKAYSLMCNIEGIPCVRVSGYAGRTASASGGHAWNKVCIDGQWYIVDCTWGDAVSSHVVFGQSGEYEFALHDWLFVTDEYANSTHFEPYMFDSVNADWGECEIVYAPQTASEPLSPYVDMEYNGATINCEIAAGESQRTRVSQIVGEFARRFDKNTTVRIPGTSGNENFRVPYRAVEMHFQDGCTLSDSALSSVVKSAVAMYMPLAKTEVCKYDDVVMVIVKP